MTHLCRFGYNSNNVDRDIAHLMKLQNRYQDKYTGFQVKLSSFFQQYFFKSDNQDNLLIMIENVEKNAIVGMGYLIKNVNNNISEDEFMVEIIVEPLLWNQQQLYDKIYRKLIICVKRLGKQSHHWRMQTYREIILTVNKEASEVTGIKYFKKRDFSLQRNRFVMKLDLDEINQQYRLPNPELSICSWQLKTRSDQFKYLKARNQVFSDNRLTLEGLRWFLPVLKTGTAISVFDRNNEVIGSVLVYWNQNNIGIIEDLFVLPQWRKQGLARKLLAAACSYLKKNKIDTVELEIDRGNRPAYKFYQKADFKVVAEDLYLTKKL